MPREVLHRNFRKSPPLSRLSPTRLYIVLVIFLVLLVLGLVGARAARGP
jgi:hypothetical protein